MFLTIKTQFWEGVFTLQYDVVIDTTTVKFPTCYVKECIICFRVELILANIKYY